MVESLSQEGWVEESTLLGPPPALDLTRNIAVPPLLFRARPQVRPRSIRDGSGGEREKRFPELHSAETSWHTMMFWSRR